MSYRKHGVRIEICFKETALKDMITFIEYAHYKRLMLLLLLLLLLLMISKLQRNYHLTVNSVVLCLSFLHLLLQISLFLPDSLLSLMVDAY